MRIRRYRLARELTMRDLARELGVSVTTVCRWENGEDYPAAARLPALAKALDCTIDQLYGRDPPGQAGA